MKYIAHAWLTAVYATGAGVAQAKVAVPFQESIRRGGSSTEASMSGYGMEGEPSLAPCHPLHHDQATQPRGALRNIGFRNRLADAKSPVYANRSGCKSDSADGHDMHAVLDGMLLHACRHKEAWPCKGRPDQDF